MHDATCICGVDMSVLVEIAYYICTEKGLITGQLLFLPPSEWDGLIIYFVESGCNYRIKKSILLKFCFVFLLLRNLLECIYSLVQESFSIHHPLIVYRWWGYYCHERRLRRFLWPINDVTKKRFSRHNNLYLSHFIT